jgi:hypothetical protein
MAPLIKSAIREIIEIHSPITAYLLLFLEL